MTLLYPAQQLVVPRPWLELYGVKIKTKHSYVEILPEDLAPIQVLLPDELMSNVFAKLGPYSLGRAACVCKQWRTLAENPRHWEMASREAMALVQREFPAARTALKSRFRCSWRSLFLAVPHARFDGIYVSRNTYVRVGAAEWRNQQTCHLVCYFRYFRFFPDGSLLYRTSPLPLSKVARAFMRHPRQLTATGRRGEEVHVLEGKFALRGAHVYCIVVYPNSTSTEVRYRASMRSTVLGANNRIDVEAIYTYDRELAAALPGGVRPAVPRPGEEEEEDGDGPRRDHRRGLSSFVFVPFEQVGSHPLNLPIKEMDVWLT